MEMELPEVTERPHRPILELMMHRARTDWGVHPNYTKEYRDLRWPGRPWRITEMNEHMNRSPGQIPEFGAPSPQELFGPGIRVAEKPDWIIDANYRTLSKRNGNWNRNRGPGSVGRPDSWKYLSIDLFKCMFYNIPFKTNTIEYKPSTQWIHIKGVPVVKYDLETGKLAGFTYSGIYDKVITFVLRNLFQMNIVLEKRKLVWRNIRIGNGRPETFDPGEDTIIDLTTFYYFRRARSPNRLIVSQELFREYERSLIDPERELSMAAQAEQGMRDVLNILAERTATGGLFRNAEQNPPTTLATLLRNRDT